jgi:hypothetical protein
MNNNSTVRRHEISLCNISGTNRVKYGEIVDPDILYDHGRIAHLPLASINGSPFFSLLTTAAHFPELKN